MARSTDERPCTAHLAPGGLDRAVADARKGDAVAFRLLYQEFHPLLLRYLWFLVGDRADDVAARAWQRAAAGLAGRRGGYGAFRSWLTGLARETAHEDLGQGGPGPDPAPAARHDATDAALRMIAELPPEEAEAVLLRSVLGLDARRAAKVSGQRPRAVRAAARRGLNSLAGRV